MGKQTTFWVIIFAALAFGSIVGFGLFPAIFTGSTGRDIITADGSEPCKVWGHYRYIGGDTQSYSGYVDNRPKTFELNSIARDGSITVSVTDPVARESGDATIQAGKELIVTGLRIKNDESSYEDGTAILLLDFDINERTGTDVCNQLSAWNGDSAYKCEVAFLSGITESSYFEHSTRLMSCTEKPLKTDNRAKLTALCCK